jgi:hypothetical protein
LSDAGRNSGTSKTKNLVGLFKPIHGGKKIYDGRLRNALQRLTARQTLSHHYDWPRRRKKEMLSRVWMIYRQEAPGEAGHAGVGIKPWRPA